MIGQNIMTRQITLTGKKYHWTDTHTHTHTHTHIHIYIYTINEQKPHTHPYIK